jgi:drug/metabolite transporter (DMT)-like permease
VWLAIVISVIGQLLYRLIQAGNLVHVTSLFYLVPIVTAVMDRWVLGDSLSSINLCSMVAIPAGAGAGVPGGATSIGGAGWMTARRARRRIEGPPARRRRCGRTPNLEPLVLVQDVRSSG